MRVCRLIDRIGFLSRRVSGKITIQPGHPSQRLAVDKGFTVNGDNLLAGKLKIGSVSATGQWAARKPSGMTPMSEMPRRSLGRTALQVSVLGFGTAPLGDLYVQLDDVTAIATVERAFELGHQSTRHFPALWQWPCRTSLRHCDQARAVPGHCGLHQGRPLDGPVSRARRRFRFCRWAAAPGSGRLFL